MDVECDCIVCAAEKNYNAACALGCGVLTIREKQLWCAAYFLGQISLGFPAAAAEIAQCELFDRITTEEERVNAVSLDACHTSQGRAM